MSERIRSVELLKPFTYYSPGSERFYRMTDSGAKSEYLGIGRECTSVRRVQVPLHSRDNTVYAFKEMHNSRAILESIERYERLNKAGAPVPTTFRLVKEHGKLVGLLMTDLTRDGKQLFINSNTTDVPMDAIRSFQRTNPLLLDQLIQLDLDSDSLQQKFERQVSQVAARTADNGIYLSHFDVPGLTFSESGLDLVLSDMGGVLIDRTYDRHTMYKENYWVLDRALTFLAEIQSYGQRLM